MTLLFVIAVVIVVCFGFVVFRGAPYVPTRRKQIQQAFDELYAVSEKDVVVDLGSGDGALLREAAKRGAKTFGYELNPILSAISKLVSKDEKITIKWADFWGQKLPEDTTVVYIFINSKDTKHMKKFLEAHVDRTKKNLKVISYAFTLPEINPKKTVGPMHLYEFKA
ncbi:hypothetical protein KC939_02085 [Candidatus Saccharibacteria bacterium]|nr:hypothetical protein [Candidatus Saccharibacteria bacterium]